MPKIIMPRAFATFDPAVHLQHETPGDATPILHGVGIDIGIRSPCVAVHGMLMSDGHLHVHRCVVLADVGLEAFANAGHLVPSGEPGCIAAESAVTGRSPVDGRSAADVIAAHELPLCVCHAKPGWRLMAINARLRPGMTAPMLTIDPGCEEVIAALVGHRAVPGPDRTVVTGTVATGHVVDALGYLHELAARWLLAEAALKRGVLIDLVA
ncbi:MAG: hypothetical protein LAT56_12870 [Wenzhouxiangella sp.]|nr:hypothetical protein [Wenzhouxiangella sp.]